MSRALDGIMVLDLSRYVAGPYCAQMLGDFGADVIKIERYPLGDISRHSNRTRAKRSPMFLQHNAGKRSMCVDIKQPDPLFLARDLTVSVQIGIAGVIVYELNEHVLEQNRVSADRHPLRSLGRRNIQQNQ